MVTPEGKEAVRLEVAGYILGTASEWMTLVDLRVDPDTGRVTPEDDHQYRASWEFPTDDAAVITIKELNHTEVARFGVTITVDTLPDLPPIGPENDLGVYGIGPEEENVLDDGVAYCLACQGRGCPECREVGSWREPEEKRSDFVAIPLERATDHLHTAAPQWLPATLADCLAGDRMRIGQEETDVLFASLQLWHADVTEPYRPKRWDHEELVLDLSANPGRRNYPPTLACEILCDQERAAALALQRSFPGTSVVSAEVN